MPLAIYSFGLFAKPAEDPANDGFHALNDQIFARLDATPGLIARSGYAGEPGPESWGPEVYPEAYQERGDGWSPATLSLWAGLGAAWAFVHGGLHAVALRRGREWFERPRQASYVLWWHLDPAPPTWGEAVARLAQLQAAGPTPQAFDFKQPFDATGAPTRIDGARLR